MIHIPQTPPSRHLSIDPIALQQMTCSAPVYVQEILSEASLSLSWEGEGFVLTIYPRTQNQAQILLQQESTIETLRAITKIFGPNTVRVQYGVSKLDIPVKDFLYFCDE